MTARVRTIDDGPIPLLLRERDGMTELLSGRVVLLSSAALETERELGRVVAERIGALVRPVRVLVGGLGFGSTVRGVLEMARSDASVVVVEKVPAVERLVRDELAPISGNPLADVRVHIAIGDIAEAIAEARDLDAILLDVDNGPHWASFRGNARLYTPAGLRDALRALAPAGVLAVWSGYPANPFLARLREVGFEPSIVPLHEGRRVRARAYIGVKRR
jgi:spermidine synthase